MPYEHRPSPVDPDELRGGAVIVWIIGAALVWVIIIGLLVLIAAPRSSSDGSPRRATTGVPPDVPAGIQPVLGEARESAVGWHRYPGQVPDGGTPSSPAPANVAGSEGTSVPTTPMPASHLASRQGEISHMGPGYPRSYLALPCKHGNVRCDLTVRLCGPADCVTLRQTDYGPSQRLHPDRIADVSVAMFERLCGVPASLGLCNGSWVAVVKLPETATERETP